MTFMRLILLCLLSFAVLANNTVVAPAGSYIGINTATTQQFLGIPYAEPPLGPLRWAAPVPRTSKTENFKADKFSEVCLQPDPANNDPQPGQKVKGSEDCLSLNIFTSLSKSKNKAVMVWLHGGAFIFNSGQEIKPEVLVEKGDLIVVTLNYRLGAMGFLSHPELGEASGNFGILDQQLALRWVQENIAAFGGDPNKVTIFGESAGGVSVCLQLLSAKAKGLFSRAINQSGPCKAITRSKSDQAGLHYARSAGCSTLECLRKLPAAQATTISPGPVGLGDTAWQPVYGTPIIPKLMDALAAGEFNRVPIINGSNRDEGRLFALGAIAQLPDQAAYEKNLQVQFGAQSQEVLKRYPISNYPSIAQAYATYMTDWLFACLAYHANQKMAAHTPLYAYEFRDRKAPITIPLPKELTDFGAYHTAEIQYIFQRAVPDFAAPNTFTAEQKALSQKMQEAWIGFAKHETPLKSGTQVWPVSSSKDVNILNFGLSGALLVPDFVREHQCDFWGKMVH